MGDFEAGAKARLPHSTPPSPQRRLGATRWTGDWADVGTPQRLRALDAA